MKKYFMFATLATAALFASCSSSDDIAQGPDPVDGENVPIKIGVAQGLSINTDTRGTGTVGGMMLTKDGTDAGADNIWAGQTINVYMVDKVTSENSKLNVNSMYNNAAMYTPGSADNKIPGMGADAFKNFGEAMLSDATINYWPQTGNFDFFGYHGGGATGTPAQVKNNDEDVVGYQANFTIDGTNDLMSTKAAPTTEDAGKDGYDATRLYSAAMARKGIHPNLQFNHLLTRLTFTVTAGNLEAAGVKTTYKKEGDPDKSVEEYEALEESEQANWTINQEQTTGEDYTGVKIEKIQVLSKSKGKLNVAWTTDEMPDADKIVWDGIDAAGNVALLDLKQRDPGVSDANLYGYIKTDKTEIITTDAYDDLAADEKAYYEKFYNPNTELIPLTAVNPGFDATMEDDPQTPKNEKLVPNKVGEAVIVSLPVAATITEGTDVEADPTISNPGEATVVNHEGQYIIRVVVSQKVPTKWDNPNTKEDKKQAFLLWVPKPAADTDFQIGTSYNINLTVYDFQRIIVNTTLNAWKNGGDVEVIAE